MNYIKLSVPRPTSSFIGTGGNKDAEITIVDPEDILLFIPRDAKGINIFGSHLFKPSTYGIKIAVTQESISIKSTSEGNPDLEGVIHEIVFTHPGLQSEILEFRTNWLNRDAIIFIRHISSNITYQYGDLSSPLRMQFAHTDSKDENRGLFTFKRSIKGQDVAIYHGTIPLQQPIFIIPPSATTLDLSFGEGQYLYSTHSMLNNNLIAIHKGFPNQLFSIIADPSHGIREIHPSLHILLWNDVPWFGLPQSTITFRVFFRWHSQLNLAIEVSRT